MRAKKIIAVDAETDPFQHRRLPVPFIWGSYDGKQFLTFNSTDEFVAHYINQPVILYAHNGGKFDYMFLIKYLKETKVKIINGRIVQMFLGKAELRDSYSAVPVPLKAIQKDDIEYWKMEKEHRAEHMSEIISYLKTDCVTLYNLMETYRNVAGKQLTIASNALRFSRKLGKNPGKSNQRFDETMRRFYFGGRTECFQPGTHKDVNVLDIHSAYPFAMSHDHATGTEFIWQDNLEGLNDAEINRSFIRLKCFSRGAFPIRKLGANGGLQFPNAHNEYFVTGWEYQTAKKFNLISDEEIISVAYTDDTINFKEYVEYWYAYKESHPKKIDPINYTIGKIMMNSLYGKLAQNPAGYFDYKIVRGGTKICREFTGKPSDVITCDRCSMKDIEHGWELGPEFDDLELHYREALWKYKFQYGNEWRGKKLFNNVATGASITGFTRAHLLSAIHTIGASHIIYCDTDSVVAHAAGDHTRLAQSPRLGDWEYEGNASIGHFAGKKLYGIQMVGGQLKIASKGSKLQFTDIEKIIRGETVTWRSEAPSFSLNTAAKIPKKDISDVDRDKLFVVRSIRSTAQKSAII